MAEKKNLKNKDLKFSIIFLAKCAFARVSLEKLLT